MNRDLVRVLQELHRLDVPVGLSHAPQSGTFDFRLGEETKPRARRSFSAAELDGAADWLVETVKALHRSAKDESSDVWFMR